MVKKTNIEALKFYESQGYSRTKPDTMVVEDIL
jgi:hypothetical protein